MSTLLRAVLRAWYALRLVKLRKHPRPLESAVARSGDPRADRVLLLGNGFSAGWGVASHRDGLVGRLAEALGDRTGRGCDLDVVGAESMNMRSSLAWVGDRDLEAVDAFVVSVGLNDALRRTPLADWERGLRNLLSAVVARLRPDVPTLVVGIPPLGGLRTFDGPISVIAHRHRDRLNDATRRIVAEYGVGYLDVAEFTADRRGHLTTASVYTQLGTTIATELAPHLVATRPQAEARAPHAEPTWQWSGTEELVALAAKGGSPVLSRLAATAQKVFKVEIAVVSLVNGDRLYYANNTDVMPESVPLDLSFCRHTVDEGAPVIIPDVKADPRFADNPLTELSFINFYAGYPLRASDGTIIGSFCLQGSRSRPGDAVSIEALRAMALQAEAELQRFEKTSRPPSPSDPSMESESRGGAAASGRNPAPADPSRSPAERYEG